MKNATIAGVFPTPVWMRQLAPETSRSVNDELRCLVTRLQGNADQESGPQWQSRQLIHRLPESAALCGEIVAFATEICAEMTIVGGDTISISACWANVLAKGGSIRSHFHPNNFLSGSYYVQVDADSNKLEFNDPRPQAGVIVPPAKDRQRVVRDRDAVIVEPGMLIVHPSWLMHAVPANRSGQARISVSFNLMFPEFGANMTSPLWKGDAGLRKVTRDE